MKKHIVVIGIVLGCFIPELLASAPVEDWKAQWISSVECKNIANTWLAYRKDIDLAASPQKEVIARIAVDSKYWLWINGEMVVFEGALKRGPNPSDTYYDEVNLRPYLKKGKNSIAVLVWYFGKEGFSHKNSGKAGLIFDCQSPEVQILSDRSWQCAVLKAFQTAGEPFPNYRLPESSILFDARLYPEGWKVQDSGFPGAEPLGKEGDQPWNRLVKRPIPLFKDFGLKSYIKQITIPGTTADTIVCTLPYNAQVTPFLKVDALEGVRIKMMTDNYLYFNGGDGGIRAEYITKKGVQEYESLGWVNGHNMYYVVPKNVKVLELKYRESGYNAEQAGHFSCSDPFFNRLWEKSYRTLYVTMRDNYMDCPERERAQWTGDAVNEAGESFYAQSLASHSLVRKWLYELIGWQLPDGVIYAPVPSGNWDKELPGQSLASIGYYGLWTYYEYTGDKQILKDLYDGVCKYMNRYEKETGGIIKMPKPAKGWLWGDWGDNRDLLMIYNLWYYMAVKGANLMAVELDKTEDAARYEAYMNAFRKSFNDRFWTGSAYRDPEYKGETDDRVQALAVVSGVASPDKYPALLEVFKQEKHSSPYMEKYVFEAMMQMGYAEEALLRHKQRFEKMVDDSRFTTLFEGWGIGTEGFGGGTVNHAWSGGGLTVLSRYLCGVYPLAPGFTRFAVLPLPGTIRKAEIDVPAVVGSIHSDFQSSDSRFVLNVTVPKNTKSVIGVPGKDVKTVRLNGKIVWTGGQFTDQPNCKPCKEYHPAHIAFEVGAGKYQLTAEK